LGIFKSLENIFSGLKPHQVFTSFFVKEVKPTFKVAINHGGEVNGIRSLEGKMSDFRFDEGNQTTTIAQIEWTFSLLVLLFVFLVGQHGLSLSWSNREKGHPVRPMWHKENVAIKMWHKENATSAIGLQEVRTHNHKAPTDSAATLDGWVHG
jgi:hypothetical protein